MSCNCIPNGQVTIQSGTITEVKSSGSVDKQTEMQKEHLKIISETMCNWAQPEYGDAGETWEKTLWKAALIAIATMNTVAQTAIMAERYSIAKDYANISEDRWDRFKGSFAPLERAMLSEAYSARNPHPDYNSARSRSDDYNTAAFRTGDDQLSDLAKRYSLCIDPSLLNDMDYAEAVSRDDGNNFNYRDEEFFSLYVSDRIWNRKQSLLNLGRGIQALSATYAEQANNALASLGSLADNAAQGAMKLLGYLNTANETQYPAMFSGISPLSGPASNSMGGSAIMFGPMGA